MRGAVTALEREINDAAAQWREHPARELFFQLRRLRKKLSELRGMPFSRATPPRHWMTSDERMLLKLHAEGATDTEIGRALKRDRHVIHRRRQMLGLAQNRHKRAS